MLYLFFQMLGNTDIAKIIVLLLTPYFVDCKNVVFMPVYGTSHIRLQAYVAEELVKMNHTVWLGMPLAVSKIIHPSPKVQLFWYDDYFEISVEEAIKGLEATVVQAVETDTEPDWDWVSDYEDVLSKIYFDGLRKGTIMEYVGSLKPDLIVLDWFPSVNEQVSIPYKLKVPFAIVSALQSPVTAKMAYHPVTQAFNNPYILNEANLFEKAFAVIQSMYPLFRHIFNDRGYMKQLFPDDPNVPTANELMSQAEVYVIESDPIFEYPIAALPNIKYIGGLSAGPGRDLQEPFKSFVERSEKAGVGVAVLSFGSMFMNIPKKLELKLVSALKRINLNTIWRANITSPDPDKILTSTWLPQNDLLAHKNVKLYMTHSGLHSIYEGIYHGVPTICMPLFSDQFENAERAENKGFCRNVDVIFVSENELVSIIDEVAFGEKIRSTIGKASKIFRELYKNPRKEAAFWIDHVLRFGGFYMRSSGQKIPMYLYVMDYVIAFLAGLLLAVVSFVMCLVIKRIYSLNFRQQPHIKSD
jgi:glucuronosyltransferase